MAEAHDDDDAHDHGHDHNHGHAHDPDEVEYEEVGLEAFGVPLVIAAPREVVPRLKAIMPPGSKPREVEEGFHPFILQPGPNGVYRVLTGEKSVSGSSDLQIALEVLDSRLRGYISLHAPDHIFIHAGVVAHEGRAIVLPGRSFSGKTTLVAELVKAGATYYSDEFAVLDGEGLVHPYPKPLSIRSGGYSQVDHAVDTLGGTVGDVPATVSVVAIAQYVPGTHWDPKRLSGGEAVLAMLSHTVPAQERPEQALPTIKRAIEHA